MKLFLVLVGVSFSIGSISYGQRNSACMPVLNQILAQKGMGSFDHPALGVNKTMAIEKGDKIYRFSALNGRIRLTFIPSRFTDKLPVIVSSEEDMFGITNYMNFNFNQNCELEQIYSEPVKADSGFCQALNVMEKDLHSGYSLIQTCNARVQDKYFCGDIKYGKFNNWLDLCSKYGKYFTSKNSGSASGTQNNSSTR